jgi:hypothetical protein
MGRLLGTAGALLGALALACVPLGGAVAQDAIPHLILESLKTPQDQLYGYLVYHEEAKSEYRLLIMPDQAKKWRCDLTGVDRIMVEEATRTYEGRDGKPCHYASFRPDVTPPPTDQLPVPSGTARPSCPTCPR